MKSEYKHHKKRAKKRIKRNPFAVDPGLIHTAVDKVSGWLNRANAS